VLALGIGLALALPEDAFEQNRGWLTAGIGGGCGGLAMALATRKNLGGPAEPGATPGSTN
jgi:hypothetical protein